MSTLDQPDARVHGSLVLVAALVGGLGVLAVLSGAWAGGLVAVGGATGMLALGRGSASAGPRRAARSATDRTTLEVVALLAGVLSTTVSVAVGVGAATDGRASDAWLPLLGAAALAVTTVAVWRSTPGSRWVRALGAGALVVLAVLVAR